MKENVHTARFLSMFSHFAVLCMEGLRYTAETTRNSEVRWKEHKDPAGKLEPAKHLIENSSHKFAWKVLSAAFSHFRRMKVIDLFIFFRIVLFR